MDKTFIYGLPLNKVALTEIFETLVSGEKEANLNARQRRVNFDYETVIQSISADDQGILHYGGEGVCNAYKNRAETSCIGICWVKAAGKITIRICTGRVQAKKSPFARQSTNIFRLYTPKLYGKRSDSITPKMILGME